MSKPNVHDLKALKELIMCSGMKTEGDSLVKCSQRKTCIRCIKLPEQNQVFFTRVPFVVLKDGSTGCEYYWEYQGD